MKEILAIDPSAVIFTLSGQDADGDYQETARMMGARRGFQKHVALDEVLAAVRETLGQNPIRG